MSRPNFRASALKRLEIEGQAIHLRRVSVAEAQRISEAIKADSLRGAALAIFAAAVCDQGKPLYESPEQVLEELPIAILTQIMPEITAHAQGEQTPATN